MGYIYNKPLWEYYEDPYQKTSIAESKRFFFVAQVTIDWGGLYKQPGFASFVTKKHAKNGEFPVIGKASDESSFWMFHPHPFGMLGASKMPKWGVSVSSQLGTLWNSQSDVEPSGFGSPKLNSR